MAAKSANPTRPGRCEGEERKKALSVALANIEKQFGKGAIMRMADGAEVEDIETVSTGSLGLDLALGVGGLPRGRIIEVFGPESSGKTTLSLQVIAEMQKIGGTCAFIDAEHALDVQYAQRLGVQLSDLLISQPDTGEQALEITDALVRSGSVDLIVVDSVAALTPKSEIEGRHGRRAARPSGPPDVPGPAQAHGLDHQDEVHGDLHQPDPHEDRRLRQPGNHDGRQRAQGSTAPCVSTSVASAPSRRATR